MMRGLQDDHSAALGGLQERQRVTAEEVYDNRSELLRRLEQ